MGWYPRLYLLGIPSCVRTQKHRRTGQNPHDLQLNLGFDFDELHTKYGVDPGWSVPYGRS